MNYSTVDYHVAVGMDEDVQLYQVVNTKTGVAEYKDTILPRVIDTMIELQDRLNEVRDKLNGNVPKLELIEGAKKDEDGGNSIH